ncbi:acetyl-CoA carboxylase carboxyl transferase subunit alpha, partial [Pseudomonas sp. FW305-130]
HRDPQAMATALREALSRAVTDLASRPVDQLLEQRGKRLDSFGAFREA